MGSLPVQPLVPKGRAQSIIFCSLNEISLPVLKKYCASTLPAYKGTHESHDNIMLYLVNVSPNMKEYVPLKNYNMIRSRILDV